MIFVFIEVEDGIYGNGMGMGIESMFRGVVMCEFMNSKRLLWSERFEVKGILWGI